MQLDHGVLVGGLLAHAQEELAAVVHHALLPRRRRGRGHRGGAARAAEGGVVAARAGACHDHAQPAPARDALHHRLRHPVLLRVRLRHGRDGLRVRRALAHRLALQLLLLLPRDLHAPRPCALQAVVPHRLHPRRPEQLRVVTLFPQAAARRLQRRRDCGHPPSRWHCRT
jgi:hypothetical protein